MRAMHESECPALQAGYLLGFADARAHRDELEHARRLVALAEAAVAAAAGHLAAAQGVFARATARLEQLNPACTIGALRGTGESVRRSAVGAGETCDGRDDVRGSHAPGAVGGTGAEEIERTPSGGGRLTHTCGPPVASPPAAAPLCPDGLTPREAEVLGLLAAGLSNREIAAALMVSVRTVGRHVDNLYGKIGVHERSKARQYARGRGLVAAPPARDA